jgi:hypothetical protein
MVARDQILSEKAGTSGLFRYEAFAAIILLAMSGIAAAAPLKIELVAAEAVYNQQNAELLISFKMSAASGKAFAELTRNNVGRKLAIRVDGQTVSVPSFGNRLSVARAKSAAISPSSKSATWRRDYHRAPPSLNLRSSTDRPLALSEPVRTAI